MRMPNGCTAALLALLILLAISTTSRSIAGVISEKAMAPDGDDQPLELNIWKPDRLSPEQRQPLIVISHGAGGALISHQDTAEALARSGFIVAAVQHTGDNYRDSSGVAAGRNLTDRPRHLRKTLDYLLNQWPMAASIDRERIGMFGFSAGGFTALVLAGGQPDSGATATLCQSSPDTWVCHYLQRHDIDPLQQRTLPDNIWQADPRIKAAAIAAPALGYMFEPDRLAAVSIPLQLWHAERDTIVEDSALTIRKLLPASTEFHSVRNAGHFAFMTPCSTGFRLLISVMELFGTEPICDDPDGFDRVRFHEHFNVQLIAFFNREL